MTEQDEADESLREIYSERDRQRRLEYLGSNPSFPTIRESRIMELRLLQLEHCEILSPSNFTP